VILHNLIFSLLFTEHRVLSQVFHTFSSVRIYCRISCNKVSCFSFYTPALYLWGLRFESHPRVHLSWL